MNMQLRTLADEAGRIEAFTRLEAATYSSEASFDHITGLLQLIMGMEMVTISLINADTQILRACQGLDLAESVRETAFCNIAIRSNEPLVIEDTHQDERVRDNPFVTGPPFLRCYIGAPLTTADGYNLGTICAFETKPRSFTKREVEIVTKCAQLVMNQLELRSQANQDFLTEVHNRRSFLAGLNRELARLRRHSGSAVIAYLDLDHFKRVNDTFGHPTGDRVLREFASIVAGHRRDTDLVARLGGEEFAVLLPDAELDSARVWAERMRRQVAGTRFDANDALRLTVSVGLFQLHGDKDNSADEIMKVADEALYQAKRLGRNCVVA